MNLCGDTFEHFVVFERQADFVLILPFKQLHIKFNLPSIQSILRQLEQLFVQLRPHSATNRVMTLNLGEAAATDQEVPAYHCKLTVPSLQIVHGYILDLRKCES
mmetsp:Transcript_9983/g.13581  ORF Transcript_9983/g.13581 Transcript_9983/m.13581 type:complete len:104 (+) Transcript_9983:429-740(+)